MEKALINEIIVGILRYSESSLIGLTSSKTCSLMIEASCHNICSSQNIVRNIYIYIYIMDKHRTLIGYISKNVLM